VLVEGWELFSVEVSRVFFSLPLSWSFFSSLTRRSRSIRSYLNFALKAPEDEVDLYKFALDVDGEFSTRRREGNVEG